MIQRDCFSIKGGILESFDQRPVGQEVNVDTFCEYGVLSRDRTAERDVKKTLCEDKLIDQGPWKGSWKLQETAS